MDVGFHGAKRAVQRELRVGARDDRVGVSTEVSVGIVEETRRIQDLQAPTELASPNSLVVLAAAKLGKTRLIDNLEI